MTGFAQLTNPVLLISVFASLFMTRFVNVMSTGLEHQVTVKRLFLLPFQEVLVHVAQLHETHQHKLRLWFIFIVLATNYACLNVLRRVLFYHLIFFFHLVPDFSQFNGICVFKFFLTFFILCQHLALFILQLSLSFLRLSLGLFI